MLQVLSSCSFTSSEKSKLNDLKKIFLPPFIYSTTHTVLHANFSSHLSKLKKCFEGNLISCLNELSLNSCNCLKNISQSVLKLKSLWSEISKPASVTKI
ncbi:CLUMA_CG008086, isoform A [Clunio marinus]|uniref:CLUMA_CG008086, isoform A n=1 Tax=Clunio marinus TaxID=568069 RepID=A0A1J1I4A4_9DIPT|nr:CLUMA_CG008086, isoform A [Clunio marinus]